VLHELILIKMAVPRFIGTWSFLIRHAKDHTKQTYRQLKKTLDYF